MIDTIRRKHRRLRNVLASFGFLGIALVIEMLLFSHVAPTVSSRFVFFLLLNLNTLALFWLIVFVGRSLIKLAIERRQGIAGHKFKTKIVGIFLLMISIPLTLMFLVSSELVTNYIDRFFAPQFREPVEGSLKVAQTMYRLERMRTLDMARLALDGTRLPATYNATFINGTNASDSASIKAALEGNEETEVITLESGDLIRAALPVYDGEMIVGVLVVETRPCFLSPPPWFTLVKTPYWVPPALAFIMRALDMPLCIQRGENMRVCGGEAGLA